MKKLLSIVLALSLCLTAMMGCFVVSAETTVPTITVADVTAAPGAVEITVTGENFSDVCAADLEITLAEGLTFVSLEKDDVVLEGSLEAEDGVDYVVNGQTIKYLDLFNGFEGYNTTTLNLTINATAAADGAYAVTAAVVAATIDEDFIEGIVINNGTVTVKTPCAHAEVKYTDNGDGTHTSACANEACTGGFVPATEPHNYVDGECVCGAVEEVEPPVYEDANLKMRGAGITMANGFALDFKVRKTMETDLGYSDIYITFQKPRYDSEGNVTDTEVVTVTAAERIEDPTNAENFIYTLEGVQPQELATMITATIYGTKDGNVYTGATVEYSVLTFASNQLKTLTEGAVPTALQVACADMIYFAAAVQEYGVYNLANPIIDIANTKCGSEIWQSAATSEISRTLVNAQTNAALDGATVRVRSAGVVLSSKVILYFNCADLGVQTLANRENYLLRASYTDSEGQLKTYDLEIDENYQALLDTLYSTELGTVVTACIIDKETETVVSNTVTYSIETFISKNLTDATHGDWCTALIKYGDSVRTYAGLPLNS